MCLGTKEGTVAAIAMRHWVGKLMLQCGAVWCSVVQCSAVCCSVLQCVATCCSVLQCVEVRYTVVQCRWVIGLANTYVAPLTRQTRCSMLQCVATHMSSLCLAKQVAVCCSVLQCDATHMSSLYLAKHVPVCCSVLQCVAVCCNTYVEPLTRQRHTIHMPAHTPCA